MSETGRLCLSADRPLSLYGNQDFLLCLQSSLLSKRVSGKIREVMRFAGPRMLFVHPTMAIKHVVVTLKAKKG